MTDSVEISNREIVKLIVKAFGKEFDYITVIAKKDALQIIGVDPSSIIACELLLQSAAFSKYNISTEHVIPILSEKLRAYLGLLTFSALSEKITANMSFSEKWIQLIIVDEENCEIKRRLDLSPYGKKSLPNIPDFSKQPFCEVSDARFLKLAYDSFVKDDTEILKISIVNDGIIFENTDYKNPGRFILKGTLRSSAKSAFNSMALDVASNVCDSDNITKLTIYVIDEGMIKFSYEFEGGTLGYFIRPAEIVD